MSVSEIMCEQCKKPVSESGPLKYRGKAYCYVCGHNLTHSQYLRENEIACPVVDGDTEELIPFGTYPNIDWS